MRLLIPLFYSPKEGTASKEKPGHADRAIFMLELIMNHCITNVVCDGHHYRAGAHRDDGHYCACHSRIARSPDRLDHYSSRGGRICDAVVHDAAHAGTDRTIEPSLGGDTLGHGDKRCNRTSAKNCDPVASSAEHIGRSAGNDNQFGKSHLPDTR